MDFQFVPSDPVCFDKLSRCDYSTGKRDQGTQLQPVGNRNETTGWKSRGQIWTECRESESSQGHAAGQRRLGLQGGEGKR